ncbi:cytochrome P450 [Panaeolus papilionaceus]|nr:cytochrome P450 [Panaeolus papilionaceus]
MAFLRVYALHHLVEIGSASFRRKLIDYLRSPLCEKRERLVDELHNTSLRIYQSQKKAVLEGVEGIDKDKKDILSISKLQSTFTFGGTDTTSNAVACILWILSRNKDIQDKRRREVREAIEQADGDIPHDDLVALPYLDAICRETLRVYSPVWSIFRKPNQDAVLPLSRPITAVDGSTTNEIVVPKGMTIICGLLASTDIWGPDSYEWKAERWLNGLDGKFAEAHVLGVCSHL